jgi:hypothetical protein
MKKITLSNLINLTKEDILSIKEHDPIATNKIILYIDLKNELFEFLLVIADNIKNTSDTGTFNYTLGIKSCLKLIDKAIQEYKKEYGKIYLDSNDKIWLSNLYLNDILSYI